MKKIFVSLVVLGLLAVMMQEKSQVLSRCIQEMHQVELEKLLRKE